MTKKLWRIINRCGLILINALIIVALQNDLYAQEKSPDSGKKNYAFNYDQEIPTLIRYGSKISGVTSKTGYFSFFLWEDGDSRSSIDIGCNLTLYSLNPPVTMARGLSIFGFGYIPFLWELLSIPNNKASVEMISPLIGYSYLKTVTGWLNIGFSINSGPAYVKKITPYKDEDEAEEDYFDYEDYLAAYESMHNISGKWGARINPKVKLYFLNFSDNTVNIGLGLGYTQYVFAHNHFNSYDIGLDFTLLF